MAKKKPYFFTRSGRPFLRWAGGKQHLLNPILEALPDNIWAKYDRLVEPFVGAASFFFGSNCESALLADANAQLISCFGWIKRNPDRVWSHLKTFTRSQSRPHYYDVREYYNSARASARKAAAFLYLNGACFNGVFRVNREGEFNVPVGRRQRLVFPSKEHLRLCAESLKGAALQVADFESVMRTAKQGDFVFVDPPYPALSDTSYFAHYTADRFSEADQERLAKAVHSLHERKVAFFLTIASTPAVKKRYSTFDQQSVTVTRYVSGNHETLKLRELFITNLAMI